MPKFTSFFDISKIKSSIYNYFVPFSVYSTVAVVITLLYVGRIAWFLALAINNNGLVELNAPFGGDFLSFYAASKLALSGTPQLVYNMDAHWAVQKTLFGEDIGYFAFFYPPIFLLYCLGFGFLSYLNAVALWIIIGLCLFCYVMKRLGGNGLSIIAILAFGGTYFTTIVGQNSFFTTALLGAFVLLVPRRPMLAGVMIGLLAFKPHLGILVPFVLIAAGMWRSFFAASLTVLVLVLASVAVFGFETWTAFFANSHMAVFALEENHIGNEKMTSLFGAARMFGAPLWFAYSLQFTSALVAFVINIYFARRLRNRDDIAAIMACSVLMITPFILVYDLTILAIPLIWLFRQAQQESLNLIESAIMMIAFSIPLVGHPLAKELHLPLAPFIVIAVFCLIVMRAYRIMRKERTLSFG